MVAGTTLITRRRLIKATGASSVLGSIGSVVGSQNPLAYVVGTRTDDAIQQAINRAQSVRHVLDFGDRGEAVAGTFADEALRGLQQRSDVRYVEPDHEMEALGHATAADDAEPTATQVLPWGIDRVGADAVHHDGETGAGSSVAIIDTGIDPTHETLRVTGGESFVPCLGLLLLCSSSWDDDHGHGTHCAGTATAVDTDVGVVGVSTDADLYAVKVLNALGTGLTSDIAAGIQWTADQGIDVASLSLGGDGSSTLQDACGYAHEAGTLLVAAAGNDGTEDSVGYPAAYEEVVAVSATNRDDDIAGFSSRGEEVDIAAPGADVLSSLPGDDYDRWDGTSMACPHVAGAAAQLMEHGYTNDEARDRLAATAEDLGLDSTEQGNGLLDVAAAQE